MEKKFQQCNETPTFDNLRKPEFRWWRRYAQMWMMIALGCGFVLFTLLWRYAETVKEKQQIMQENVDLRCKIENIRKEQNHVEFTPKKLADFIVQLNIKHPKIVFAQAILESGQFKSVLFEFNHNLFGMRKSYSRPTTGIPYGLETQPCYAYLQDYAFYFSWEHSVYDYALWQAAYARTNSETEYFSILNKMYAEDTKYVIKLKQIISGCDSIYDILKKYNFNE